MPLCVKTGSDLPFILPNALVSNFIFTATDCGQSLDLIIPRHRMHTHHTLTYTLTGAQKVKIQIQGIVYTAGPTQ